MIARAERARVLALRATVLHGVAACLVLLAVADPLAAAFTDDPGAAATTAEVIRLVALGHPFAGVTALLATYFQARGLARPSYVISVGSILAVHLPLLLALSLLGTPWLWISFPAAALLSAAGALLILRRTRRRGAAAPHAGG
ncbi:hypothetical protein D7319_07565 [Streptomyces radicis]|uniref:Uncharacterized protein n=1 Tax=Streptomyces radicis TaxID=1750517 RepID=A0A3A9WEC5_9ACTN|nr:hypothetical protein D7319_07565 [Streptomyces radicis]RKN25245.1 hypothetical protein D7318_08420 [Streptomyces radicis]